MIADYADEDRRWRGWDHGFHGWRSRIAPIGNTDFTDVFLGSHGRVFSENKMDFIFEGKYNKYHLTYEY